MPTKYPPATPELRAVFKAEVIKQKCDNHAARKLAGMFLISRNEAIEIYREVVVENPKKKGSPGRPVLVKPPKLVNIGRSRAAEARQYAATHDVTGYRLRKMFGITMDTARRIAKEFNNGSPTRLELSKKNQEAAITHAYAVSGKISGTALSAMFGLSNAKAQDIMRSVRADIRFRALKPEPKPTRIVRRFRDLSGTNATADERRYPSGIGFGVVEVVR